jgi:3-hydroxyisobutyrate dehydrogenase
MAASSLEPPAAIGFVGLGNMGRPMAKRLAEAGYQLFLADKNESTVRTLVAECDGTACGSLPELARRVDAVITMVPDGKSVREIVLGENGLVDGLRSDAIVLDMSSSEPVGTRELGAALAKRGVHLIDAPVSGGVKRAVDGSLSAMVGGDPEVIERVRKLLGTMAKQVFLTGSLGTGHAMKALNNLVSAAGLWITAEALLVGQQFGLAPENMIDVLNASTGRNNSTENKFKQQILSRAFASGFSLDLMAKDLRTAQDLAIATGSFAPLMQRCAELWNEAAGELGAGVDHTAAVQVLEHAMNRELLP